MKWIAFVLLKESRVGLLSWRFLIEAMHDALVELQDSAFRRLSIPLGGRRFLHKKKAPPASTQDDVCGFLGQ